MGVLSEGGDVIKLSQQNIKIAIFTHRAKHVLPRGFNSQNKRDTNGYKSFIIVDTYLPTPHIYINNPTWNITIILTHIHTNAYTS